MNIFEIKKSLIRFVFILYFVSFYLLVSAQDSAYATITTRTDTAGSESLWYTQPWAWIACGVAILLLLLALFSGGTKKKEKSTSRTDKVTITKTIRTETDIDE